MVSGEIGQSLLPPLVDEDNLQRYLAAHLPGSDGRLKAERIDQGHSNLTFLVTRAASALPPQQFVLRRPEVATVLIGTRNVRHLEDAVQAAAQPLDTALLSELEKSED